MEIEITLRVDGAERRLRVDTRTTLLDALRERRGITRCHSRGAEGHASKDMPIPHGAGLA